VGGRLTDDDLERVEGWFGRLFGVLQERYGWARKQAEEEVARRFDAYRMKDAGRR